MPFFLLFIVIPIIEIALFILVGGAIGVWPTLLGVLLTAIIGSAVIRHQGGQAMSRIQDSMQGKDNPAEAISDGVILLISGVFLMTPGYFTDTLGFLLLIPKLRRLIIRGGFELFKNSIPFVNVVNVSGFQSTNARYRDGDDEIIEGEFEVKTTDYEKNTSANDGYDRGNPPTLH